LKYPILDIAKGDNMKKLMVFALVFIFLLSSAGCAPKPKDAITIVKEYYAAMNAHDVDKALSYLADDAMVCCTIDASENLVQGKEEIRKLLQQAFSYNLSYLNSDYTEKDGEVRCTYTVTSGSSSKVVASGTDGLTIVKDGKIIFDGVESNRPK
jgi:hypothetical protein